MALNEKLCIHKKYCYYLKIIKTYVHECSNYILVSFKLFPQRMGVGFLCDNTSIGTSFQLALAKIHSCWLACTSLIILVCLIHLGKKTACFGCRLTYIYQMNDGFRKYGLSEFQLTNMSHINPIGLPNTSRDDNSLHALVADWTIFIALKTSLGKSRFKLTDMSHINHNGLPYASREDNSLHALDADL